jgi:6-phosphogluconolactonase
MSEWHLFDSQAKLDIALTDYLGQRLQAQVNDSGRASLAVSGGNTPKGLFRGLSHYPVNWSQVDITLVDERWVATDSDQSNERLVRQELLQHRAAGANFFGLKCDAEAPELAVAETRQKLADLQRPFSVVVLGMGEDGHTASWFPQASNLQTLLDPAAPALLAATDPVTAPHQRLTQTLAAVLDSKEIIIHITGAAKREVLQSARDKHLPVAAILRQTNVPVSIWWAP